MVGPWRYNLTYAETHQQFIFQILTFPYKIGIVRMETEISIDWVIGCMLERADATESDLLGELG